ncbi:SETMR methyltransferase, partial [Acromyrmex charruanus]
CNMDQTERESLIAQAAQLNTREEFLAWEERWDNFIESLEAQSCVKRPRLSLIARITRLESLKDSPRQFLENVKKIVTERVRDVIQKHGNKARQCKVGRKALLDRFNNILKKKPHLAKKKMLFYQDNVRVLTCPAPMAKVNEFRYELLSHPAYSPDLAPCDYFLFPNLKKCLEKLASYLDKDKLKITQLEFFNLSAEDFDLLTRKDIFPYEYVDCVEKLEDTCLPPCKSFYSSLTGDTVSENDYTHAMNVWQRFSIRTLDEYSDLYLKTDVLLADIFENFRTVMDLIPYVILPFYVGRDIETYSCQFRTSYRR